MCARQPDLGLASLVRLSRADLGSRVGEPSHSGYSTPRLSWEHQNFLCLNGLCPVLQAGATGEPQRIQPGHPRPWWALLLAVLYLKLSARSRPGAGAVA